MNPPNENILVIRRSLFDELGAFQGLSFEPEKYLRAILLRGNNFFIPRSQAESDPAFKQIIPYALIVFQNSVLHYVRGKKAGEHVGRVAVRASGSFNVQTSTAVVQGISWRYCRVLSRGDGYTYHTRARCSSHHDAARAPFLPTAKAGDLLEVS